MYVFLLWWKIVFMTNYVPFSWIIFIKKIIHLQEKQELQNQYIESNNELLNLREDHMRLQEAFRREREEFTIERENNNKVIFFSAFCKILPE